MDYPGQIYNCDESGMPLEHKVPKTKSPKRSKKNRQKNNKTQITILLACANAIGQTIPPVVNLTGKYTMS